MSPAIHPKGLLIAATITNTYLIVLVIIPIVFLIVYGLSQGLNGLYEILIQPRVSEALRVSFLTAFVAGLLSLVIGFLLAWVLGRYQFFGRSFLENLVDLPLALPTAVAGLALASLYFPNTALGEFLAMFGIQVAFAKTGIVMAMIMVSVPLVVRNLQPLIQDLDVSYEEAAYNLGANRAQTFFMSFCLR
jgi:sulfate transport system permease protein